MTWLGHQVARCDKPNSLYRPAWLAPMVELFLVFFIYLVSYFLSVLPGHVGKSPLNTATVAHKPVNCVTKFTQNLFL